MIARLSAIFDLIYRLRLLAQHADVCCHTVTHVSTWQHTAGSEFTDRQDNSEDLVTRLDNRFPADAIACAVAKESYQPVHLVAIQASDGVVQSTFRRDFGSRR